MRRALVGLLCGIVSSPFLCLALRSFGLGLALGALLGIAQVFAFFDLEGGSAIDRAMTCAALGLPFWAANQCRPAPVARRRRATMDSCGNASSLSCANWLVVVLLLSWNPVSGGSSAQQILSWSRIAAPRAFPSSKNNPSSYSRRRLRWGYNSGTSRKAVSG